MIRLTRDVKNLLRSINKVDYELIHNRLISVKINDNGRLIAEFDISISINKENLGYYIQNIYDLVCELGYSEEINEILLKFV
jgi:hypothetical protein